ncbi:hypothetical protein XFF6990_200271 [Xanthomonas citri pv. fuscans]|nr:hypothetical protein XFF6990_200271 [Xanthomonas citri pv. fuscans]
MLWLAVQAVRFRVQKLTGDGWHGALQVEQVNEQISALIAEADVEEVHQRLVYGSRRHLSELGVLIRRLQSAGVELPGPK